MSPALLAAKKNLTAKHNLIPLCVLVVVVLFVWLVPAPPTFPPTEEYKELQEILERAQPQPDYTPLISFFLIGLPFVASICAYNIFYQRITGHSENLMRYDRNTGLHLNRHAVFSLLEHAAFFVIICVFLSFKPTLPASIVFCLCSAAVVGIRLIFRLQPARDERAAPERQAAADREEAARLIAAQKPPSPQTPLLTLAIQGLVSQKKIVIGMSNGIPICYRDKPGDEEELKHTLIIAASGFGKTTAEANVITQKMYHGEGVFVLAAESPLFNKLLPYIPESRMNDLIYFQPEDLTPPIIGFNPFTLGKGENLNQKIGETREILKRAMGKDLGVTMVPVIDNVVSALVRRPHATFADVMQLIDPANKTVRASLKTDPTLTPKERDFWKQYDDSTYYRQAYGPVYNRFNPFSESPIDSALATSSFSFKDLFKNGRYIVFLDLSELRGQTLVTMGQLLLASIEQALLSRNPDDPNLIPYSLFIDEFQKYAEDSEETLKELYNGARKYKLGVTIAHQSMADIPQKLMDTIIDNVGTTIAMRLSAKSAPYFAKHLQLESPLLLQNLQPGQAYVGTPTENVGLPTTIFKDPIVPLPKPIPSNVLKTISKENFGTTQSVPTKEHLTPEPEQPTPQRKKPFGIEFD